MVSRADASPRFTFIDSSFVCSLRRDCSALWLLLSRMHEANLCEPEVDSSTGLYFTAVLETLLHNFSYLYLEESNMNRALNLRDISHGFIHTRYRELNTGKYRPSAYIKFKVHGGPARRLSNSQTCSSGRMHQGLGTLPVSD